VGNFNFKNGISNSVGPAQEPRLVGFDLGHDGAQVRDMFEKHISKDVYIPLLESGWTNTALRRKAIELLAKRILELHPDAVSLIDMFFWDTFSRSFGVLRERPLKSALLRTVFAVLNATPKGREIFDLQVSDNSRDDFMETLEIVSQKSPVYVAKLIDDARSKFVELNYAPVAAAMLVRFLESVVGSQKLVELGIKGILLEVRKDIPVLVQSLADSMDEMNSYLRRWKTLSESKGNSNVHLVSGEEFLLGVGKFLKPETAHPSVFGAFNMNRIFTKQLESACKKETQQ
jgi:hypothetical protein